MKAIMTARQTRDDTLGCLIVSLSVKQIITTSIIKKSKSIPIISVLLKANQLSLNKTGFDI